MPQAFIPGVVVEVGIITFSTCCGTVAHVCQQLEATEQHQKATQWTTWLFPFAPIMYKQLYSPVDQGLLTTASMVIPLLIYWSLGTKSQSALVAALICRSVGPFVSKCTPVGIQDLQPCGAQVAGMGSIKTTQVTGNDSK